MPHYGRITATMEPDPFQPLHNSNTISEPAAVEANPGHLMYSHTVHLTQGLGSSSYQYPTDTHSHIYTHLYALGFHENPHSPFELPLHSLLLTHKNATLCLHILDC